MTATASSGRGHEAMRIAGERVDSARRIEVRNPWDGSLVGTVPKSTVADVRRAFTARLTRYERSAILTRAAISACARASATSGCVSVP
jgi:phosphonoacetaldehyde dehydrogenase